MRSALENQIREHLRRYLGNQISLEAFEEWLVPNTWNLEQTGDTAAENLVYDTEFLLAEHSSGLSTIEELRRSLRGLSQGVRPIGRGAGP